MALSANLNRDHATSPGNVVREFPVLAGQHIYVGAAVGLSYTGYAKALVAPDQFVGFCYKQANNTTGSSGDTTDGSTTQGRVKVIVSGHIVVPVSSIAVSDVGKAVYATYDDTFALVGHPDTCVGFVVGKYATDYALIRIREPGQFVSLQDGSLTVYKDFSTGCPATGAVASAGTGDSLIYGSALGLGVLPYAASGAYTTGLAALQFDNTAEVALAYMQTAPVFNIAYGITFSTTLNLNDIGDAAALDTDWGIGDVLNATTRANLDDAGLTKGVRFHMDGNSANIMAQSIGGTTPITSTDTTADNVTTVTTGLKRFDIIARPTGICELYVAGSRVLSSTVFDISTSGLFGAFINMEKTSDDTTALALVKNFIAKGSRG